MKLVFTSIDYNKIKIIESTLLANGIKSILKGEDLDVLNGIIPRNSNLLELYVNEEEFDDAISIIENAKSPNRLFEEDKIDEIPNNKYDAIKALAKEKDKLALYKFSSAILAITSVVFLVLYLLEIDNFKKFYNATFSPNMNYYFSNEDNCLYESLKSENYERIPISTQCYDRSTGIRKNAKYYNINGNLISEVFNPELLEFDTKEITYDYYGKKIFEYIDSDKDGIFDELIEYDHDGFSKKKYKDTNGNFRFEINELK
ncbi:putative signal transducing protein [Leptospira perdikensis]|uniref:DUF2007 domain-containing protein n=1 Tax=Leptospira perdikensis TaxID=2484948 RepID=A0A4V3JNP4_9LEPT|nr:DUF2007 domain-containing protein [Leptospira perdikensis]TGL35949.1 DUF2007 domain-containing protein [Leptospira perdikensis]